LVGIKYNLENLPYPTEFTKNSHFRKINITCTNLYCTVIIVVPDKQQYTVS